MVWRLLNSRCVLACKGGSREMIKRDLQCCILLFKVVLLLFRDNHRIVLSLNIPANDRLKPADLRENTIHN